MGFFQTEKPKLVKVRIWPLLMIVMPVAVFMERVPWGNFFGERGASAP